ncbi:MAG: NfeD family protein [Halobacteriota archaeon]|nr:NfeD family protein [Halobacteriota archaeon]
MEITDIYVFVEDSWVVLVVLIAFIIFGLYASIKLRLTKPTTGSEYLIGEVVKVDTDIAPEGTIKIKGEFWNARAEGEGELIKQGEKVEVVGKDGLTLIVKRI